MEGGRGGREIEREVTTLGGCREGENRGKEKEREKSGGGEGGGVGGGLDFTKKE
jgi:hypothetical protein